jgi:hypothetical protein
MDEEEIIVGAQALATALRIAASLLAVAILVAAGIWIWRRLS